MLLAVGDGLLDELEELVGGMGQSSLTTFSSSGVIRPTPAKNGHVGHPLGSLALAPWSRRTGRAVLPRLKTGVRLDVEARPFPA